MLLESLPKMNRLPQSDTTSILVRQLNCLLYLTRANDNQNQHSIRYVRWNILRDWNKNIPCIDRIPQPLGAVSNMYPVTRQLISSLLSTQWSELSKMPVPVHHTTKD
jgi:hypothetical protein